jgi:hypothetical protein
MRSRRQTPQCFARAALPALLLAVAAVIAGCAGATVADHVPTAIGGLPDATPPRPGMPSAYPAVNNMPSPRDDKVLTSEEQHKIEDELIAARNRVPVPNAPNGKPAANPVKPVASAAKPSSGSAKPAASAAKPAGGVDKPDAGADKPAGSAGNQ